VYAALGWKSWGDWLGTGRVANTKRNFAPFLVALKYARSLNLKTNLEWNAHCKAGQKPANIPAYPDGTYRDKGWQDWGHWLGTGAVAPSKRNFMHFRQARAHVRKLGLKNEKEWRIYSKSIQKPKNIPSTPDRFYKDKGWSGWADWLRGGGKVR
jgi:hypothetical protein